MRLLEFINALIKIAEQTPEMKIGATFSSPFEDPQYIIAATDLIGVLVDGDQMVLHFEPLPIMCEALQVAEEIANQMEGEDPDAELGDNEVLPF